MQNDNTSINGLYDDLESYTHEYDDYVERKRDLLEDRHYYDIVSRILNEDGVKNSIIRYYLPLINKYINKYLREMNFYVNFQLDEKFNETINSRNRDKFTYSSFSEGERMRIDLALLFTWRDIARMKNSVNTNLLILDEVFDSSLDFNGTEDFLRLIGFFVDHNIFIISHKGDILYDKFKNIILYKKVGNFSIIQ
jgi:DNA repair exonuclease SbcCD ATPase subunit